MKIPFSYKRQLKKILSLHDEYASLSDEALAAKTIEFKERYKAGESLDKLLPEAFATVREASKRTLNMEPYPVQLLGGIVLHGGNIAEQATGEGKTLVAAMPSYLNALTGNGVHVVTVNDYLAKRDAEQIGQIHRFLGLTVGCVLNEMENAERKAAYACDITYVTNNEAGFDYLRDNMVTDINKKVQRGLNYAIIDEVDSILIDEARTPLIISRKGEESSSLYVACNNAVKKLKKGERIEGETSLDEAVETGDYYADEKDKIAVLTESGVEKVEKLFNIKNLSDPDNAAIMHGIQVALKANAIMKKDRDYVVTDDGKIDIVDEFTGRILKGRRYSDGLHQAIEAKEGVEIQTENKTVATVTFQHFFNYYNKKSGMTGTALTEKDEFKGIYHMNVYRIPTNKPVIREDLDDYVFLTKKAKYKAVVEEIKETHAKGQPILVGTTTIEVSEFLHRMLIREGIPHTVLNAKYHAQEAAIVAKAGELGAVTIATNMAGRGTDIKLGEGVAEKGGLYVLGTERHESRRIDNQLRGRSGRQGDPGKSRFYVSLEDDLMRLYGQDNLIGMLRALNGGDEDMLMEHKSLSRAISKAQRKIEAHHYGIRKSLLDFDSVNDEQRKLIYEERDLILGTEALHDKFIRMAKQVVDGFLEEYDDYRGFCLKIKSVFGYDIILPEKQPSVDEMRKFMYDYIPAKYDAFRHCCDGITSVQGTIITDGTPITDNFARQSFLRVLDRHWVNHIDALEHLREGIGLQSYGQRDPKIIYKQDAYQMFDEMLERVRIGVTTAIFQARPRQA